MPSSRPPFIHHARAANELSSGLAYARALVSDRAREPMEGPGHRIYWMSDTFTSYLELPAGEDHHLVAGTHELCDIRLIQDASIDDRHLLIRSEALDDGCPVLEVLDLDTRVGFSLSDGSRPHSIAAIGPIVLRVGSLVLVALPSGERLPNELPEMRCRRGPRTERRRVEVLPAPSLVIAPLLAGALPARRVSDVLVRPGPITISEVSELDPSRRIAAGYELTLESTTDQVSLRISREDLDHGLLIGRDPRRCVAEGLKRIFHLRISRVHLLLLRQREEIVVHDVASMNGTWVDRRRIRTATLDDDGTELFLGTTPTIRLVWSAIG